MSNSFFLAGIFFVIFLSGVFPEIGRMANEFHVKELAIMTIFALSGFGVSLKSFFKESGELKSILSIQLVVFVLPPALFFLSSQWMDSSDPIYQGIILIAILPTTITSCVVCTLSAGGNSSLALVSAVGGNIAGVFLSPLLLAYLLGWDMQGGGDLIFRTMFKLCQLVLLPFLCTSLLRTFCPNFYKIPKIKSTMLTQICLLTVMFIAFSRSLDKLIESFSTLWLCFIHLALLHLLLVHGCRVVGRWLKLKEGDGIAFVFCSSQKTLALGIPLAEFFFEGNGTKVGVVILPLVFYHFFQLTYGGFLMNRLKITSSSSLEAR